MWYQSNDGMAVAFADAWTHQPGFHARDSDWQEKWQAVHHAGQLFTRGEYAHGD